MRAVILAGGSGTRLWPLSRETFPKQFLPLLGRNDLLQDTVERVRPVVGDNVHVVTTEDTQFLVADRLRELGIDPEGRVLGEPMGRNTAPAIGLAALCANPEEVLLVLPSDHAIRREDVFREALLQAQTVAEAGHLVTFGISPSRPDTGYGYIRMGEPLPGYEGFRAAARFVEKPNRATAEQYLAEGGYVWNSGMFAFRAGTVLDELAEHAPEVYAGLLALEPDLEAGRPLSRTAYGSLPKISIDYAVMERSRRVAVIAVDPGWSDLGGFEALLEIRPADHAGNVVRLDPGGDAIIVESRGNLVWGGNKVVALVGVEDTVVVDTDDALLVCAREQAQSVRDVAERLKVAGRSEASVHRTLRRPWGSTSLLEEGRGYKITRMHVKPGARLPLQRHNRRREHWVVVSGTAEVTQPDETCVLRKDESTSIPLGTPHRLENRGTVPLEIIVIQHGEHLGEDDTVLLEEDRSR